MTEETLFEKARNLPVSERRAFLDRECQDPAMRSLVDAMLAADAISLSPLDSPIDPKQIEHTQTFGDSNPKKTVSAQANTEAEGVVIAGRYKLRQQIGEGGMGTVWMADQTEPVKRKVAVKLIRVERGQSKTILARFEAERQAIALMDHPHIAKLLDAGTTDQGSPFFIMELVKGIPLNEYCDQHKLTIHERLNLFMQICSAVQHAHQKGIIHRDLKPGNILVESHDGKPVPKVIDFGLAKATTGLPLTDQSMFTAFGSVMGTPLYMAPEQATFNAVDVDTRADVYALGVILYELLTGTTPITRETLKKAALDEMLKLIREQEAPTPSSRLSSEEGTPSVAASRQIEPAKLGRFVKGELDWIVMKALAKERDRRYESATNFAKDIERFLNHEPVQAGPPSASYRLKKFVRRNRGQVLAASFVLLALIAGVAGTTLGLIEARHQAKIAKDEAEAKEKALTREEIQREAAEKNAHKATTAGYKAASELHDNQRMLLNIAWEAGETDRMKTLVDAMRPEPGEPDFRGFETHFLDRLLHSEIDRLSTEKLEIRKSFRNIYSNRPNQIHYTLNSSESDVYATVNAIDLNTGRPVVGFTPIVVRSPLGGVAGRLRIVEGDIPRLWLTSGIAVRNNVLYKNHQAEFRVWDARTGQPIAYCEQLFPDPDMIKQGWQHWHLGSGDGDLAHSVSDTSNRDASIVVTQLVRGDTESSDPTKPVESRAQLHAFPSGKVIRVLDARAGLISIARFSFDGRYLVTEHRESRKGEGQGTLNRVTVWEVATGKEVQTHSSSDLWQGFARGGSVLGFVKQTDFGNDPTGRTCEKSITLEKTLSPPRPVLQTELSFVRPSSNGINLYAGGSKIDMRDNLTGIGLDLLPQPYKPMLGSSYQQPRQWAVEGGLAVAWEANNSLPNGIVSIFRRPRTNIIPYPEGPPPRHLSLHGWIPERISGDRFLFARSTYERDNPSRRAFEIHDPTTGQRTKLPFDLPELQKGSMQHVCVTRDSFVLLFTQGGGFPIEEKSDSIFRIYDRATQRERCAHSFENSGGLVSVFGVANAMSSDDRRFAFLNPDNRKVTLLDADTGKEIWNTVLPKLSGYARNTSNLHFQPGDKQLLVFRWRAGLTVLNTSDGSEVAKFDLDTIADHISPEIANRWFGRTPDGRTAILIDRDELIAIDIPTWTIRHRLRSPNPKTPDSFHTNWLRSADNRYAFWHDHGTCEVWDIHTGKMVQRFQPPVVRAGTGSGDWMEHHVLNAVCNKDCTRAFVLSPQSLRIIDLQRGRDVFVLPLSVYEAAGQLSLSPDECELTLTAHGKELRPHNETDNVVRRVFDARPVTEEEIARRKRLDAIRPTPFKSEFDEKLPIPPVPIAPPVTAADHYDKAFRATRAKNWSEAASSFGTALQLDPDFYALRLRYADALELSGDLDGALAAYREAIKKEPRDFFPHYRVGRILASRGKHRDALTEFREALKLDTRKDPTQTRLQVYMSAGETPSYTEIVEALAVSLFECGEFAEVEKTYRDALQVLSSEADFAAAMVSRAQPTRLASQLARLLLTQKKVAEAKAVTEECLKRIAAWETRRQASATNTKPVPKTARAAQAASEFVEVFAGAEVWSETVDYCNQAIKLWEEYEAGRSTSPPMPKFPGPMTPRPPVSQIIPREYIAQAYFQKATALHALDRGKDAVTAFDEAISRSTPTTKEQRRLTRARYVAHSGEHVEAIKVAKDSLNDAKPNYWEAALVFSLSSQAAKDDAKLREQYASEAVVLLRNALGTGRPNPTWKKEPDLVPLHNREDFKQWLTDLEAKLMISTELAPLPREINPKMKEKK